MELKISNDVKITSDDFNYIINLVENGEYVEKLFFSKWKDLHIALNTMKISGRGKKGGLEKFNNISSKMNNVINSIYDKTWKIDSINVSIMNYNVSGIYTDVVVNESRDEWASPHVFGYFPSVAYALCCILDYEVRRYSGEDVLNHIEYVVKELLMGVE